MRYLDENNNIVQKKLYTCDLFDFAIIQHKISINVLRKSICIFFYFKIVIFTYSLYKKHYFLNKI